ncbi:hypothetical protein SAMN06265348_102444 [Pedobacter westerhofensis]|uniref:Uncharacterized protein n=1 Tax=Pedobacter westerhofensis TaxID=425512 RepID=A0A521BNA1_9SPHI|nr:DUF6266 family protein [Pedobacter westerhofensis]SMO48592.1 hypothetical protein SAMN06265348_102444 [Pedobacter westerhofensis]
MARVVSGPYVGFSGTIDGTTYYQMNGKTYAKKKNSKSNIPRTEGQLATESKLGMIAKFMPPFEEIAKVGYQLIAKASGNSTHNEMVSHIFKKACEKQSGKWVVNMEKFLITQGKLASAKRNSAEMTMDGVLFNWSNETGPGKSHHSDQVIMLAYFPELKESAVKIGGASRNAQQDLLLLTGVEKGYTAEIFISFIADDHSDVANSIYLGQLNW